MLFYLNLIEQQEDKTKFEQLYIKYKHKMINRANIILKDQYLAQDCAHKAFIKLAENINKIQDIDSNSTKSYVITITENVAIDMYRKNKKEKIINYEEIDLTIYQAEKKQIDLKDDIEQALMNIPLEDMTIIKLKYIHNYSTKEIAKILKISEKALQKKLERGREKLKQELKKIGVTYNER